MQIEKGYNFFSLRMIGNICFKNLHHTKSFLSNTFFKGKFFFVLFNSKFYNVTYYIIRYGPVMWKLYRSFCTLKRRQFFIELQYPSCSRVEPNMVFISSKINKHSKILVAR